MSQETSRLKQELSDELQRQKEESEHAHAVVEQLRDQAKTSADANHQVAF